jgi:hypothetical protein
MATKNGEEEMKGQCFCGAVQYEVDGPLKFVAHDHCSICRRISGAAFVTWAGVPQEQFKLIIGNEVITKFKTTSEAERQFCSRCGSHLFFRSTRWPGEVHFTVATLTDKLEVPPKAHVFYSDRIEWMHIQDDLPKYGGKTGTEPLK